MLTYSVDKRPVRIMRIVLTEQQYDALIFHEQLAYLLQEDASFKKKDLIRKLIKQCLIAGMAVGAIITAINQSNLPAKEKLEMAELAKADSFALSERMKAEKAKSDSIYQTKVNAVRSYMAKALENQNYSLQSTKLKPETLVKVSMKTGFDLPFIMAVAHQESCFGATPRAKKTGSVFSEGLYDNGHNAKTYSDPNDSVYGFIDLLNNDYLRDGKTLHDLLKPGSFVNYNGDRYAMDSNYENKIKYLRNKIVRNYPELS